MDLVYCGRCGERTHHDSRGCGMCWARAASETIAMQRSHLLSPDVLVSAATDMIHTEIGKARALHPDSSIIERDKTISDLRAALAERDEVIAQQEAVAAEYANARRDLWRQAEEARALVAARDATIAQLRAEWDKTDAALVAAVRRVEELREALLAFLDKGHAASCATVPYVRPTVACSCGFDEARRIYAATGAGEGEP